jgi:hypothetical protein
MGVDEGEEDVQEGRVEVGVDRRIFHRGELLFGSDDLEGLAAVSSAS